MILMTTTDAATHSTPQTAVRLDFDSQAAGFSRALGQLDQAATKTLDAVDFDPKLRELIRVRASQLNGCAFCIQFHLNEARKIGVAAPKLDLLPAWRETTIYSVREAAALAFTEHVTLIAGHPIEEEAWVEVRTHFSEAEMALLTTAIAQINFWNRLAAPLRFTPPIPVHTEPLANS